MLRILFKIIFYCALAWIVLFLWTITGGQAVPVEFQDYVLRNRFYDNLFAGMSVAILCTLFGTIRKGHNRMRKVATIAGTCLLVVGYFIFMLSIMFEVGFGVWSTFHIPYEKRGNPAIQILEQRYDVGALGYGGTRVVEVSPVLGVFWRITPVDLDRVDSTEWIPVNKGTM